MLIVVNFTGTGVICSNCSVKEKVNGVWDCPYCPNHDTLAEAVEFGFKACDEKHGVTYYKTYYR